MKTKLIILALALTCLGAESPQTEIVTVKTVPEFVPIKPILTDSVAKTEGTFLTAADPNHNIPFTKFEQVGQIEFTSEQRLRVLYHGGTVLDVKGLPREKGPYSYIAAWLRPDKPADAIVTLYTADGKRWRAQWVEDNP